MFTTLVVKELKAIFFSPKFSWMVAICSFLMLLSVFVGIQDYRSALDRYAAANDLVRQEMREARDWASLPNRVYRQPDPLQIFAAGIDNDIGRYTSISAWEPIKLVHSAYNDDPIFAVFRYVDFAFIVEVVLTLLAILFTYDAINGERERGTLQLALSNAVPRARYIAAKFVGSWLGLTIPVTLAVILGLLLLFVYNIPMNAGHWARLGVLLGISYLLLTFFLAFGVFVSSWTRRSSDSFLICLVSWVAFVLIIPRAGVMLAGQVVHVPGAAEIQSRYDMYSKDRWKQEMKRMTDTWRERMKAMQGMTDEQQQAKIKQLQPQWQDENNAYRIAVLKDIDANGRKLNEEVRNMQLAQERVAFSLSRISPVSAYQLAVMNLAGTDIDLKNRYEDQLNTYRTTFNEFRDRKQKESGSVGGLRISVDSKTGIKVDVGREIALDLSTVPQFVAAVVPFVDVLSQAAVDYGLLLVYSLLAMAGAFVAFQRYDVR